MTLLKVVTPFDGVTASVPPRPVPLTRVRATGFDAFGTGFPLASSTVTVMAGDIAAPVNAFEGCCENASLAATGVMEKLALVAEPRPVLVATSV